MIGQVIFSAVHRGVSFSAPNGNKFYLLNGQSVSRTSQSSFSPYWPSGYYGSTASAMHLPDVTDLYVRGHAFNRSIDAGQSSRVALSGTIPSGTAVGTLQLANLGSHTHASGTIQRGTAASSGPNAFPACGAGFGNNTVSANTTGAELLTNVRGRAVFSGTLTTDFDVPHTKCYVYMSLGYPS